MRNYRYFLCGIKYGKRSLHMDSYRIQSSYKTFENALQAARASAESWNEEEDCQVLKIIIQKRKEKTWLNEKTLILI